MTGCLSFVVMQRRGLVEALTTDRHFEQANLKALMLNEPTGQARRDLNGFYSGVKMYLTWIICEHTRRRLKADGSLKGRPTSDSPGKGATFP